MDENEKKIVNFIDEIRGQTHELEIPPKYICKYFNNSIKKSI